MPSSQPSNVQSDQLQPYYLKSLSCHLVFKILYNLTRSISDVCVCVCFKISSSLGPLIYPHMEEAASGLPKHILFFLGQKARLSPFVCSSDVAMRLSSWELK